ncbi:MAG TPA: hypothetical protein VKV15_26385 [Bryobacteraceae bacterium]|nr:hypothetical protein [Bryobacteraceae bacterium]
MKKPIAFYPELAIALAMLHRRSIISSFFIGRTRARERDLFINLKRRSRTTNEQEEAQYDVKKLAPVGPDEPRRLEGSVSHESIHENFMRRMSERYGGKWGGLWQESMWNPKNRT